jgi:hypothetical protein
MMDIKEMRYECYRCGGTHQVKIDFDMLSDEQRKGEAPVNSNFVCPDIATMYKIVNFNLDLRINILKEASIGVDTQNSIISDFKQKYGEHDFDSKLKRIRELDFALAGIPEEYYSLLIQVLSTYHCGYFYPSITGVCALGERILNRLILKTRSHFTSSSRYKQMHGKHSLDNWDILIDTLLDWKVITTDAGDLFRKLKKIRNESIHYNDGYDFNLEAKNAIRLLIQIVNQQFDYLNRKDIFWLFDCPGEIFVRSEVLKDPFVIEFILPHCVRIGPLDEPTATPPVKAKNSPLKPLLDEEYIQIRNNRSK